MPTWPASLPQRPLASDYTETPASQVLRSQMAVGPPKTRRRSTASTRTIPVAYNLTKVQADTFEAWFDADIGAGALPFDWPNPRTDTIQSVMITGDEPYQLSPIGSGSSYWRLSMTLEIQP
ncbi:hypothetical protein [Halomonas elongata]|uniref:Uncharacterized protein n=2 Tax=Halomonas elongata TaxID=2746 RepID=E1VAB4_HALED|nr:hypothetical protein [Halomonas elongata]OBX36999.1 hypothetical protein A8U91_01347 [Halomonas elongata]WBF19204.1 hypothetical protein LM502_05815 [Halomonas elongata]WPU48064.1 hypothetical protein SR933_04040 [Halomonas elongata DSM 2581]CBV41960.1 uncharacterized protein HELO_2076 [Halomonas elongata DSM 2581]